MNGYSRISADDTTSHKSRSMDFSDVSQTPPKASCRNSGPSKPEVEERKKEDEGDNKGERFGVILGRSASVSCSAASGFQVAMKRAFSMRRSSSVSERYCRIHDQFTAITSPIQDHEVETTRTSNKKHRGAKILKACKRLLRL